MKRSVSLPADDLAALDDFARSVGLPLRSAAIQRAIRRLRHPDPEDNYIGARDEWMASGEQDVWGGRGRRRPVRSVSIARIGRVLGRLRPLLMAAVAVVVRMRAELMCRSTDEAYRGPAWATVTRDNRSF